MSKSIMAVMVIAMAHGLSAVDAQLPMSGAPKSTSADGRPLASIDGKTTIARPIAFEANTGIYDPVHVSH